MLTNGSATQVRCKLSEGGQRVFGHGFDCWRSPVENELLIEGRPGLAAGPLRPAIDPAWARPTAASGHPHTPARHSPAAQGLAPGNVVQRQRQSPARCPLAPSQMARCDKYDVALNIDSKGDFGFGYRKVEDEGYGQGDRRRREEARGGVRGMKVSVRGATTPTA